MRKRLWLASPVLAFALLASTANAEEIALPTEQATLTQTPELVPVKFGTHTVEFIEDDRSFSSTATQSVSSWEQVSDAVFKAVKNYEPQLQIKISMTDVTSEQIISALKDGFGKSEYTYGIGIDTAMSVSSAGILTVTFTYPVSIEKEQAITKYVKDTAANIFNDQMTDFQKVRAAYEYIITNTNYAQAPVEDGGGHSIYSIMKDGVGVCQAYALLFYRLMEEEGIESKYIVGKSSQNIDHAWNVVTLEGKTYHIDVTYGDPVFSQHLVKYNEEGYGSIIGDSKEITMPQYVTYNTFLMSEEQLAQNAGHSITEERPYTKPTSNDFAAWHNVANAVTLDGKHYYYQNTQNGELEMADFTKPTLTPQTFSIDTYNNRADNLVVFNNRILFSNIYGQLSEIMPDGTIHVITDGYEASYDSENDHVGYIEVTDSQVNVYALEATISQDNKYYDTIFVNSTKRLIYKETIQIDTNEIDNQFAPNSPIVQQINNAVSKDAFKALLKSLSKFVNVSTTNEQLLAFQQKVQAFDAAQQLEQSAQKWTKTFTSVPPKKTWTVQFSMPVAAHNVHIVNIFGTTLAANVTPAMTKETNDTLTITPTEDYVAGADYYIVIPKETKTTTNETLKDTLYVPFTFK